MNTNLLRAKMAMHGDFYIKDLEPVLEIDYGSIQKRFNGSIEFKLSEIKKIAEHYQLEPEEINQIFDLGGKEE